MRRLAEGEKVCQLTSAVPGYCGGYGGPNDLQYCTGTSFAKKFKPIAAMENDLPTDQAQAVLQLLPASTFTDDGYLGKFSSAGALLVFTFSFRYVVLMRSAQRSTSFSSEPSSPV